MENQLIILLSTIYGEAAGCSPAAWKAVASVILNRVGVREWRKYLTPSAVIQNTGFDAYKQRNAPYVQAEKYFTIGRNSATDAHKESLYSAVDPLYRGWLVGLNRNTTDAVLYYSPKAQAALHKGFRKLYTRAVPKWATSPLVERVEVPGTESDDFAWFRYRAPQ